MSGAGDNRRRYIALTFACIVLPGLTAEKAEKKREIQVERWATRQGNVIQVHPSEVTFEVPEAWRSDKTSFRLTPEGRRQKVWTDVMGMQIADGALSLQDCAAQIDPSHLTWLRVYVVDSTEEQILKQINEKGWRATKKFPYVGGYSGYQTVPAKEGPWMHVDIPYTRDFGDYNGTGYVSFYLRPAGERALVIAMGAFWTGEVYKPTDERQNVLKSVVIPESAAMRIR